MAFRQTWKHKYAIFEEVYFVIYKWKARKICKKCNSSEQIDSAIFIVNALDINLISTVRTCYDKSVILIKTPIEVSSVLDILKTLRGDYFLGSINHKVKCYKSGNYAIYLVNEGGNLITWFIDTKLGAIPIDRLISRTNKSLCTETRTLCYITASSISSQSNVSLSKLTILILPWYI